MKRLKKFYKNNRVYCILMIICIICIILMSISVFFYFVGQTSSNPYGNRLNEVKNYDVDKELKDLEDYFTSAKECISVSTRLQGKIIYVTAEIKKDKSESDISDLATESLKKLTEEQLGFYDIQFIFKREGMPPYLGSKSSNSPLISWANYNLESAESEDK